MSIHSRKNSRISLPSGIVSSVGLRLLLLFARLLLETLIDLVTARAPDPPATTGLPTPNLNCASFAFRVRVLGPTKVFGGGGRASCSKARIQGKVPRH